MPNLINTQGAVEEAPLTSISLSEWQENAESYAGQALELRLTSEETADLIGEDCQKFERISLDFPKFVDGRSYSAARLLREKYQFSGELKATGDVLIDQLFYMKRCGFDTFALRDDQIIDDAISAFSTFSNNYQTDVLEPKPLFKRR